MGIYGLDACARNCRAGAIFADKIQQVIAGKLCKKRDSAELAEEQMKCARKSKGSMASSQPVRCKICARWLIDIEFLVQYLQLNHSHQYLELIEGNIRLAVEKIENHKLLTEGQIAALKAAAGLLLDAQCILRLIDSKTPVEEDMTPAVKKCFPALIQSLDYQPEDDEAKFAHFKNCLLPTKKTCRTFIRK